DHFASGAERLRIQGVACGANLRLSDVIVLRRVVTLGRSPHDPRVSLLDVIGTIFGSCEIGVWRVYDESAVEAAARAHLLFVDLVADGIGDPVLRLAAFLLVGIEGQMRKALAFLATQVTLVPGDRHMAPRALVFDVRLRFWVVDGFPP